MIRVGFNSNKGLLRENNEDSYFIMPKENLFIVADGLGGYNAGQTASGIAVSKIAETVKKEPLHSHDSKDIVNYLKSCVEAANIEIIQKGIKKPETNGMATTLVLCYIDGNKGYFANAGDSRGYIYRDGKLTQVTRDHSYVGDLIRAGKISEKEGETHRERHKITKALGVAIPVEADYYVEKLMYGDIIMLCSDGLYGEVCSEEMQRIMEKCGDMSQIAEELVNRANENGGSDNITVICIKVERGISQ